MARKAATVAAKAHPVYKITAMTAGDRIGVIDVLNHYVETSFAAYPDTKLPYEFFDQITSMCKEYVALAARDERGELAGFALLRAYHPAATFRHTAEVSYFLGAQHTGRGLGAALLDQLTSEAQKRGITCLVASVSSRNQESLVFHRKHGFKECGHLCDIGVKFGQSFGVVWFQKRI